MPKQVESPLLPSFKEILHLVENRNVYIVNFIIYHCTVLYAWFPIGKKLKYVDWTIIRETSTEKWKKVGKSC